MNPSLIPLQQWYCDKCGEVIQQPDHGYLEWKDDPQVGRKARSGFRVVHHALYSPARAYGKSCYYPNAERGGDLSLPDLLGPNGLVRLSAWIDVGEEKEAEYRGCAIGDFREWTVLLRRLHIPYYEEARQYLQRAQHGAFGDANEITFYLPETLKEIIVHYREEDGE